MALQIDLRWPNATADGVSDVAEIRIGVRDHVLTRLFDESVNETRDRFRASAVKLGFWFADNWWRLRWEPIADPRYLPADWRLRHEMSSGAGEEAWPPIMIYGAGPRVIISPIFSQGLTGGRITYLGEKPQAVTGPEYEASVGAFLQHVLGTCARHPDAQALGDLIAQIDRERVDEELSGWRRLEACLGYDADEAPEEVVEAMIGFEESIGEESVDEAAVASPGERAPRDLAAAIDAARGSDLVVDLTEVRGAATSYDPRIETPWQAAEDAAYRLRELLNLRDVVSWEDLGEVLRIRWGQLKEATATARHLPYAARAEDRGDHSRLALQMNPQIDRRFELARMIGDEVWSAGRGLGIVSRAKTDRQKFQRAFAQSLLCPISALQQTVDVARPTPDQITRAARRFGVRDSVIATILVNRGYLPRERLSDWLEAA